MSSCGDKDFKRLGDGTFKSDNIIISRLKVILEAEIVSAESVWQLVQDISDGFHRISEKNCLSHCRTV